ncbi:MAG TPA: ABATE domain-containing protein [Aggregatilinea sp.]|uniref:CGNR zinc finger domain-containing protein n=1 Tax=Aggregatilinea sp. TaxID=2806333 RepID=UPI002B9C0E30|nr:ABATE domain-containing protein [Aggregatilinea sp.]HML24579.1 ABATE domain-containing protein [Aggregatilinea sp.]
MIQLEHYHPEERWICLDFANTNEWHASAHPTEHLNTYADLVAWAAQIGVLPDDAAQTALAQADVHPADALVVLGRARVLREAIYRIVVAMIEDQPASDEDMATLNDALAGTLPRAALVATEDGFEWGWEMAPGALDAMIGPIARSAADLLTSEDRGRIGQCADDRGCGWLFYDRSRNRSRRWCSMESCGNRAKAKQHYERERGAEDEEPAE